MSGTHALKNLVGQRFDRLVVLRLAEVYDKAEGAYWICKCNCGNEVQVKSYSLRSRKTRSCGCFQKETARALNIGKPGQCAFTQLFNSYKHNARGRSLSFDLNSEQFRNLTQGRCFYCGVEPSQIQTIVSGNGDYVYNGIDRTDSSKGYTIENCVPCCGTHNLMKLEMSVEEFIAACRAVVEHIDMPKAA